MSMDPHTHAGSHDCHSHHVSLLESQSDPWSALGSLKIALGLSILLTALEFGLAHLSHSLVVLADAGHLLSDTWVLGLVVVMAWIRLRANHSLQHPVQRTVSVINGLVLLMIGVWLGWDAVQRLQDPPGAIWEAPMILAAVLNLGINGFNTWLLHAHSDDDYTVRAVFLHMVGDAIGAFGILVAAVGIQQWSWLRADDWIGLLVAGLIIYSAVPLLMQLFPEDPVLSRKQTVQ